MSARRHAIVPTIFASIAAAIWVPTIAWMLVTSLKPLDEIARDPTAPFYVPCLPA